MTTLTYAAYVVAVFALLATGAESTLRLAERLHVWSPQRTVVAWWRGRRG